MPTPWVLLPLTMLIMGTGNKPRGVGMILNFQYESNMMSGCRDNDQERIDQSEASIWQKITGVWWYAVAFCVLPRRPCVPSMKLIGLIDLEKTCLTFKVNLWSISYSLFILRKPHPTSDLNGEQGFLRVNKERGTSFFKVNTWRRTRLYWH